MILYLNVKVVFKYVNTAFINLHRFSEEGH
jgi:hypothetical protein